MSTFQKLFPKLVASDNWKPVNLDAEYRKRPHLNMKHIPDQLRLLDEVYQAMGARTYGGFRENRSAIWEGFEDSKTMIHLGVDFNNLEPGEPVASLTPGHVVHVLVDKSPFNGWGTKVIIATPTEYFLYGHLTNCPFREGDHLQAGDLIGEIAPPEQNGGWFPHLHLQVMDKAKLNVPISQVDGYEFEAGQVSGVIDPLQNPTA